MSQLFTASQRSALRQRFVVKDEDQLSVDLIDTQTFSGSELEDTLDLRYLRLVQSSLFATAAQGVLASTALQPGQAATQAQGTLADTAVQPARTISAGTGLTGGGDLSANRTISLNAASIASLALADSALQVAPVLKVYHVASATGATPETFTIPNTPATNSDVIVVVEGVTRHPIATDPPGAGNFYRSGTTVKTNTVAGNRVSIYYVN